VSDPIRVNLLYATIFPLIQQNQNFKLCSEHALNIAIIIDNQRRWLWICDYSIGHYTTWLIFHLQTKTSTNFTKKMQHL